MILGTVVHGLEVSVLLLLVLMCVQVYRVQRSEHIAPIRLQSTASLVDDDTVITVEGDVSVERVMDFSEASRLRVDDRSAGSFVDDTGDAGLQGRSVARASSSSSAILNDYIGAFFAETQTTNLEPYRDTSVESLAEFKEPDEEVVSNKNISALKVVPPTLLEPVLLNVGSLDEADDDAFIVVQSAELSLERSQRTDVMSDKVVHAMLKEAELALPS